MVEVKNVIGSVMQAQPLVIGKDIIYVHTNITPVKRDGKVVDNLFSYDEIQYSKDEYLKIIIDKNEKCMNDITNLQLALTEIYELIEGGTK